MSDSAVMVAGGSFEEFLLQVRSEWKEAQLLNGKEGDEKNPYEYKYKARDLFQSILHKITVRIDAMKQDQQQVQETKKLLLLVGQLCFYLGSNYYDAEEFHESEKHLTYSLLFLQSYPELVATVLIEALNSTAILWSSRSEFGRAESFLKSAEQLYYCIRDKSMAAFVPAPVPESTVVDASDPMMAYVELLRAVKEKDTSRGDVVPEAEDSIVIEARDVEYLYTLTLFYIAQVYGHQKNETKSALYCQQTLERQLVYNLESFNAVEWGANCLGLTAYYMNSLDWERAERCLYAAEKILPPPNDTQCLETTWPQFHSMWGKYCVARLAVAKEYEREGSSSQGALPARNQLEESSSSQEVLFHTLELPDAKFVNPIRTFEQARDVFLQGLKHLKHAKEYYVLDGFVTDHVALLQDESSLYRSLQEFEPDLDRKYKMHKRRVALLEPIIPQLNPSHFEHMVRQLMYTCGETYSDMADIRAMHAEQGTVSYDTKQLNEPLINSLKYFHMFIKSFEREGKLPNKVEDEYQDAYLMAYFNLARLYPKIVGVNATVQVQNVQRAIDFYKAVVAYCQRNNVDHFQEELAMCKEMIELLPVKLRSMQMNLLRS